MTNDTIHTQLTSGELKSKAAELAANSDVHTLSGKLKTLYEGLYGKVGLDALDWNWQATALKNTLNNAPKGFPNATAAVSANAPAAAPHANAAKPNAGPATSPAAAKLAAAQRQTPGQVLGAKIAQPSK